MASPEEDNDLDQRLLQVTNNLLHPPSTTDELIPLLQQVEHCLRLVAQESAGPAQGAVAPLLLALIGDELLRHADVDVKVAVASCISEITRISAPDAPLDDDPMKEAFQLIVSSFENLHDMSSRSYRKRTEILETVSKVRSCVLMLDLECDDLILEMFQHFLKEIREHHPEHVFSSMQNVMTVVLEESEDISPNLLSLFLDSIKKETEEVLPIAKMLVENVLESCATKLKPYLVQAVNTLGISFNDYSNILASICHDGSGSLEQNDGSTTSEHAGDESKSVKEPPDESAPVIKEDAKEAAPPQQDNSSAPPQQDNPVSNHSPKSGTNNGNPQAAEDGTLVDSKSPEKQEATDCTVQSKGIHFSANEDPTNLDTEKVDNSEKKHDQSSKRRATITISSAKSAKPSEGSYLANVKEDEKVIDSKSHSKEYEKVIVSESNSKEDEKVIDSESHSKENEKVVDSDSHSHSKEDDNSDKKQGDATMKRRSHPISLTKLAEPPKRADPANVKEVEKVINSESHGNKDDNNDQKQAQVTKKRGKRKPISSTKLAEPPKGSYPANVKEDEKIIESESHGNEGDNNVRMQGQVTKKRGKRKPISSTKSAEPPKGSYPANVKEDEKVSESEIHSKEDDDSDQNQGLANKKGGRQSSSSTKSAANVQDDVKVIDSESHSKEVPSSLNEDDSVKASGLSESDKEIDAKISSLKAGDGVSDPVSSPSPRVSLHGENRSKNLGRSKKKDSSAKKVATKDVSKKVYEETSDSEAKPTKRSVKKALGPASAVEKNIVFNSVKKGNGTASEPDAKKQLDKKTEAGSKGGGGSDKKKLGPGKANSEIGAAKSSVKNVDKEIVSLSKSATKSIEDSEELPKTNLKRKHTPGKENESGIKKYGENLVGTRVKVWWPDDDMFYEGVVECFIPSKKMHQVTYDDGDIEILNLKNETWEILTGGADSDVEEGADHPSPDAPADIPPKKKGKTSTSESRKGGNKDASISGGGATSSKSRGKSIKSSHRSKDGSKSKVPKIAATESDDEVIMKTKNHTPKSGGIGKFIDAAARKMSSSKSDDTGKDDVVRTPKLSGKAKQETPKTGKLKQETTSKTAATSSKAAKSSKSGGGKSNSNGTSKVKFKLLEDSDDDNDSEDSANEVVEDTKAKKSSSLKAGGGGSEVKIGKKRARS
ncbi:hypothetical protein TanjilG_01264 [Lupinus angustifolius]|uniref:Tudor domain-containing protein n=1 Tax=Lupinus angustifolius TaxID=3871 RepID=A0A4P1RE65_LUPAN|nr:PREDICTED: transcriptional regulator ATRX-like [Lupinus angustifolius]OIW09293.1 hypothetical protein TanjilG_01264 [Lupinus angustifolius]